MLSYWVKRFMGGTSFFSTFKNHVEKVSSSRNLLQDLDRPQIELHMLWSCLSLPKINQLLLTVLPGKADQQLFIFDQRLLNSFSSSPIHQIPIVLVVKLLFL